MMKQKGWCVGLSVACVLLVFCAVRTVRGPATSEGAQGSAIGAARVKADQATKSTGALYAEANNDVRLRQLETAGEAQRIKQEEAAQELQWRQQETTQPLSENPGLYVETAGIIAG